jgi:hypothetical protein
VILLKTLLAMPTGAMIMAELNQHILYINSGYNNECSLNQTVQSQIDSFGDITYRTLITDINGEEIESNDMLKEQYGISLDELDCKLTDKDVVKYESEISFYEENRVGANVEAFDLICSLKKFITDADGNGSHGGLQSVQTTQGWPRQSVFINDEEAERWLIEQLKAEGHSVKIIRVD